MQNALKFDHIRKELPGVFMTLGLVAILTALLFALVWEVGLAHGSVVFLIPVVIAATRWGVVSAVVAAICGVLASAFFFFPPLYSFGIKDPQEVIDLSCLFVAIREPACHAAEVAVGDRAPTRDRPCATCMRFRAGSQSHSMSPTFMRRSKTISPRDAEARLAVRGPAANGRGAPPPCRMPGASSPSVRGRIGPPRYCNRRDGHRREWRNLARARGVTEKLRTTALSPSMSDAESKEDDAELRIRLDTVLADATATLERLGVAHAINEARMRAQTDQLRDALIGSVSHELRTPLASILGAATVLASAPALQNEKRLTDLAQGVRDEAERLNNDIQNLLDATRICRDGVKPRIEWADPADILHSALDRCRIGWRSASSRSTCRRTCR